MEAQHRRDLLTVLYPVFKEEVYRRRGNMMRLAAGGTVTLLALLTLLLLSPAESRPANPLGGLLLGTGAFLAAGLFSFLILQQRDRHRMAKQTLIDLERSLGFYEAGFFSDHRSLYPTHWETAWLGDRSHWVYIFALGASAMLVCLAILFGPSVA